MEISRHAVDGLEVTPDSHIEHERRGGPDERAQIAMRAGEDVRGCAEMRKDPKAGKGEAHHDGGTQHDDPHRLHQHDDAFGAVAAARGLRDVSLQPVEEVDHEENDRVIDGVAQRRCADGERRVRQPTDHHGVHDVGGHPAQLAEREWDTQAGRSSRLFSVGVGNTVCAQQVCDTLVVLFSLHAATFTSYSHKFSDPGD